MKAGIACSWRCAVLRALLYKFPKLICFWKYCSLSSSERILKVGWNLMKLIPWIWELPLFLLKHSVMCDKFELLASRRSSVPTCGGDIVRLFTGDIAIFPAVKNVWNSLRYDEVTAISWWSTFYWAQFLQATESSLYKIIMAAAEKPRDAPYYLEMSLRIKKLQTLRIEKPRTLRKMIICDKK